MFAQVKWFAGNAICVGAICLCAVGCTPEKVWVNQHENTWYQIGDQNYKGDFVLENIQVIPNARQHFSGGISLNFRFGLSTFNRLLLRDETDLGYTSYRLTARILNTDGKPLSQAQELNQNPKLPTEINQEMVFRIGAYSPPEFFFPFRDLPLRPGMQQVIFEVKGYAQMQGKKPQTEPSLLVRIATGFVQPKLFSAEIGVQKFELDTDKADPHSFDFRMAGSGYPDLCWRLFSGANLVHTSAVAKNKTAFNLAGNAPAFVFSENDSIRLQFFDDDELSDNDMLANWLGTPAELLLQTSPKSALRFFGNKQIKNAGISVKLSPIPPAVSGSE